MFLLDTNVVSELRNSRKTNPLVASWAGATLATDQYLSAISVQEMEIGTLLMERKDPVQGMVLRHLLENVIQPTFMGRILPVDNSVAIVSAQLYASRTRPYRDAFIAATALVRGFTLLTRNVKDFEDTGVKLINPWVAP
jgi:toxin FitB